jgi:dolichol-phosphate mannosyltransferase
VSTEPAARSLISRHSPIARKTRTATTVVPIAATSAPMTKPIADPVEQSPLHWTSTRAQPIVAPATPAIRIEAKARARASREGRADSGLSSAGTLGMVRRPQRGGTARPTSRSGPSLLGCWRFAVSSPTVSVTVVVPTYDEASNIETLLRRVRAALPDADVLIVDDGSPDGTADIVEGLASELGRIQVLRRPAKSGLGSAYREGFALAMARGALIIVQMDADLSHDPAALPALVSIVEHGVDLAMGSRYVPGARIVGWPARRHSLSRWGNRYAAGMLGLAVNDATAGYRAYSADALRRIDVAQVTAEGYGFQIEMTYRHVKGGGSVVEVPIIFVDREHGISKLSGGIVREALWLVTRLAVGDALTLKRWRRRS